MKMFLLGALVMWFILSYLYEFVSMNWGENVIGFPMAVCGVLFTILVSPFVLFWCIFLRHTIKPVTSEQLKKPTFGGTPNICSGLFMLALIGRQKDFATRFSYSKSNRL